MVTVLMQFPNASEINKLYDGRRHTIRPLKLFNVTINKDTYYVLGYEDLTCNENCMTLLKKVNGRLVNIPLNNYDGFEKAMNDNHIKETTLDLLDDVLEIDCAPITTIKDIITKNNNEEKGVQFSLEEIPSSESKDENKETQTSEPKKEIMVEVLSWRDGFSKKYAVSVKDYNMLFYNKEEKKTFEYNSKNWIVINKRLLNFIKDQEDIKIVVSLRKPYFYKEAKEKRKNNEDKKAIPVYISKNKWNQEALFIDIDLYENILGDFDISRTTKTIVHDGIEHSVVEVYKMEISALERKLKVESEIIRDEVKDFQPFKEPPKKDIVPFVDLDDKSKEDIVSVTDSNTEPEKEIKTEEKEDPNQLYFEVYEDYITGQLYIKQALYKAFISKEKKDAISIIEKDLSVLITEVAEEQIKKIEDKTKAKRNIVVSFLSANYFDDESSPKKDAEKK